jgi:hypothetical protein
MQTPTESGASGTPLLIASVATLAAAAIAGTAWALIGYYIATALALGLILLPIGSGCGAGLLMRIAGHGFQPHAKWVALTATLLGCIAGDFLWIMWATNKPVNLLLGNELVPTLNTLLNLQKAVLYAVACYLAFSIASPTRAFTSE